MKKLTATLSDGKEYEILLTFSGEMGPGDKAAMLRPVKRKLRPAPEEVLVHVGEGGDVNVVWPRGEHPREAELIKSGDLVRYVRDDERYDEHEEVWESRALGASAYYQFSSLAEAKESSQRKLGLRLVRIRVMEEVPHE